MSSGKKYHRILTCQSILQEILELRQGWASDGWDHTMTGLLTLSASGPLFKSNLMSELPQINLGRVTGLFCLSLPNVATLNILFLLSTINCDFN